MRWLKAKGYILRDFGFAYKLVIFTSDRDFQTNYFLIQGFLCLSLLWSRIVKLGLFKYISRKYKVIIAYR